MVLTAAQPPGTTPATRTGESPRRVSPRPPSLLRRQITWTGPQRARAQNTDRGPCSNNHPRVKCQNNHSWSGCVSIKQHSSANKGVFPIWTLRETCTSPPEGWELRSAPNGDPQKIFDLWRSLSLIFCSWLNCIRLLSSATRTVLESQNYPVVMKRTALSHSIILTSFWKISVTWIVEKSGGVISGFWLVRAVTEYKTMVTSRASDQAVSSQTLTLYLWSLRGFIKVVLSVQLGILV